MPKNPRNHRKPWTADDLALLTRLAAEHAAVSDICKELGRTRDSVYVYAWKARIRLRRELTGPTEG